MDEVIRGIEQTDSENIQDVLSAVFHRYRELYPQWKIVFLSVDPAAKDDRSAKFRELIYQAERIGEI